MVKQLTTPRWMTWTLIAAGLYNLVWGVGVVLTPAFVFEIAELPPPRYLSIWQCVGMIVGVYGIGYLVAARDPARHWPIVLVGFLGKVFGPIGFVMAASRGELPWAFGWTIISNDLLWWIPFALMLRHSWIRAHQERSMINERADLASAMKAAHTSGGASLYDVSESKRTLVVFLRHLGCTFCREALADLRDRRAEIERAGTRIALIHMAPDKLAAEFLAKYKLSDVPRFSDPDQSLYAAFGLQRGGPLQLFGPRVWWRGLIATLRGHRVGKLVGDGFQMPGAFLVENGMIKDAYRHATAADRPDYYSLACPAS